MVYISVCAEDTTNRTRQVSSEESAAVQAVEEPSEASAAMVGVLGLRGKATGEQVQDLGLQSSQEKLMGTLSGSGKEGAIPCAAMVESEGEA